MAPRLPEGFRIAAQSAGIAKRSRPDLLLAVADQVGRAAACFTRNQIVAAPVALSREHLRRTEGRVRAILVNAGCANACTGPGGDQDAMTCARWVAELVGCDVLEVLVFSTGVIGQRLPLDKIEAKLPELYASLSAAPEAVEVASRAILTTDTVAKVSDRTIPLSDGGEATLVGMAKGSGMIHPDMATMLGFLFTDLDSGPGLDLLLRAAVSESFHRITVDGDTSTNDSVLLWSSARRRAAPASEDAFFRALAETSRELAKAIARDGEGATKLIEVHVRGAATPDDAVRCARTIAMSPLVKTAVHGEDPNWGRILAAAGRSGAGLDTRRVRVGIGDVCLFETDEPRPEREPAAREALLRSEVVLWVDLGRGPCEARFWSCDFSADYVRINADYRT